MTLQIWLVKCVLSVSIHRLHDAVDDGLVIGGAIMQPVPLQGLKGLVLW